MTRQRRRMGGPVRHWGAVGLLAWCIGCQSDSGDEGANTESPDAQMENGTGASTNGDGDSNGTGASNSGTGATGAGAGDGSGAATGTGASNSGTAGGAGAPPINTEIDESACAGAENGAHCLAALVPGADPYSLYLCGGDQVLSLEICRYGCAPDAGVCSDMSGGSGTGSGVNPIIMGAGTICQNCALGIPPGPGACADQYEPCDNKTCNGAITCLQGCGTQSCRDDCYDRQSEQTQLTLSALEDCWWSSCTDKCTKGMLTLIKPRHPVPCENCLQATCDGFDACLENAECGATFECLKLCESKDCYESCGNAYLSDKSRPLWTAVSACATDCGGDVCWYPNAPNAPPQSPPASGSGGSGSGGSLSGNGSGGRGIGGLPINGSGGTNP